MKIVMLGLTITSSWGNGHATTYRSLCRALSQRGHDIFFLEKDVEWYRSNRDLPQPDFCEVTLYSDWPEILPWLRSNVRDADAVLLGSYFPEGIAAADLLPEISRCPLLYYDIDTPITLAALREQGSTAYIQARQIPFFDAYLSFTGGPLLQQVQTRFHAQRVLPFYCSVDPQRHHRQTDKDAYRCDLSYLGTYAPDRQEKLEMYLNGAARALPAQKFIVAGPQYPAELRWPSNVARLTHIAPPEHPRFYSSSRFTLNLTRKEMVDAGYSPSVRLFEAAACGAAIVSDRWPGLETFFAAQREILLPASPEEMVYILRHVTEQQAERMGQAARARILAGHTADHRAQEFEHAVELCANATTAEGPKLPWPTPAL